MFLLMSHIVIIELDELAEGELTVVNDVAACLSFLSAAAQLKII